MRAAFRYCLMLLLSAVPGMAGIDSVEAGELRTFSLNGTEIELEDISKSAPVFFRSMRLNRAANTWNVEVLVSNAGPVEIRGPLILSVESFKNTSGVLSPDGTNGGRAFLDISALLSPAGVLASAQSTATRTIALGVGTGSPSLQLAVFGRGPPAGGAGQASVRSLDGFGQPLGSVEVLEQGPGGSRQYTTDPRFGLATLGQGAGQHSWRFTRSNFLPAWRQLLLASNKVAVIPNPRLVSRNTNRFALGILSGGVFTNESRSISVTFAPGSVNGDGSGALTDLSGQTLPSFLPLGWSPLQGFSLELTLEPNTPASAALLPWEPISRTESAVLTKWNPESLQWIVTQVLPGNVANPMTVSIPGTGVYALAVSDDGSADPGTIKAGQPLIGLQAAAPDPAQLRAAGSVDPPVSTASAVGELVTANATATFTNLAGPLLSGALLRCAITESYTLQDGSRRQTPGYETFVVGYHRPGSQQPNALTANFPLRPLLLLGADQLQEALIHVDVLAPSAFSGVLIQTNGGFLVSGGIRILIGAGDLAGPQAASLREIDPTNFLGTFGSAGDTNSIAAAFQLDLPALAQGRHLAVEFPSQTPGAAFVLARVVSRDGVYGLEPVERFLADAAGVLRSSEPPAGNRLPGVDSAGQYLLLRDSGAEGLVTGITRDAQGASAGNILVRLSPWITFSDTNGLYRLIAPTGSVEVAVSDLRTGAEGTSNATLSSTQSGLNLDVAAAPASLRILNISPVSEATSVSRVAPVIVTFSRPVNPGTLGGNGIALFDSSNQVISASITLNLAGNAVTLLPSNPLPPSSRILISVSTNLSDLNGQKLTGTNIFTFTTETDALNRLGAKLDIFEPVNGVAGMAGGPGLADSESPVILVNETSGETATILSRIDGSFSNNIPASVDDMLSVVIVNRNGSRNIVPASRQIFRDGSIGLFNGGGIVEVPAANGPIQLRIDPGAIPGKTVFKVLPVERAKVLQVLNGVTPPNGEVVLGGFALSQSGDEPSTAPHVSVPVDVAQLGLPAGTRPEDASFALAMPVETDDGSVVFEIVDRMHFENGKLVTSSPPFVGPLLGKLIKSLKSGKALNVSNNILHALGLPGLQETILHELFLPIMLAQGTSLTVSGRTISQTVDANMDPIPGTDRVEAGTIVTESRGVVENRTGRLRTGDLFASSDERGFYALMIPVNRLDGDSFSLTGSHPAFPFTLATATATLGKLADFQIAINADLIFPRVAFTSSAVPDVTAPKVLVSVEPRDPLPGTNVNQGATVTLAALDDQAVASFSLKVDQASLLALNPGLTNPPKISLTPIVGTATNSGPRSSAGSFRLTSDVRATVKLNALATDAANNVRESSTTVIFAGDRTFPPPGSNDVTGPRVLATWPPDHANGVAPGTPVTVLFSEPIADASLTNPASWLTVGGSGKLSSVKASADAKSITIYFSGEASDPVTFSINSLLTDRSGNPFDQDPGVAGAQPFNWTVNLVAPAVANLPDVSTGGGVVANGRYLFALDRTPGGANDAGALAIYDLASPGQPLTSVSLTGPGRDLVLLPNYSYRLKQNGPVKTGDLLAVVGGTISADTPFQYLRIFDVSDPANPVRIGGASISLQIGTVGKVQWAPPFLAYLESGADVTSIGVIDLQSFLIGFNATPDEIAAFPEDGISGIDANHDGDFVDQGDTLPVPRRNPAGSFFGKEFSVVVETVSKITSQRILDFDFNADSGLFGMTLSAGFLRAPNGSITTTAVPPAYRTISTPLGLVDPDKATLNLTNDLSARPKRVAIFGGVRLDGETNLIFRNIAVVSLADISPPKLALIDITDPLSPFLLKEVPLTDLGTPQTLLRRSDGLMALGTSQDVILIDPAKLLLDPLPGGQLPFIVGVVEGAGSGANAFAAEPDGVNAVNLGSKHSALFTAPSFSFVTFPNQLPQTATNISLLQDDSKRALLATAEARALLTRTKFFTNNPGTNLPSLASPNPNTHYYIRVDALGSLGATLPLVLESLNNAGAALANPGPFNLPVRLAPDAALNQLSDTNRLSGVPSSLSAVRLSSDPESSLYNIYLAGPISLSGGSISTQQVTQIENQLQRAIVHAGRLLWVGLDSSAATAPYPAAIDSAVANARLVPGASAFAQVDSPPLPVILIPGVAGSHLTEIGPLSIGILDRELWPGFTDAGKTGLSLKPGEEQKIVVRDVVRFAPEPYEFVSRFSPLGCLAVPIYYPLIDFLTNQAGLREYDYLKPLSGPLTILPCVAGTSLNLANTPEQSVASRTVAGLDSSQLANEPNLFIFPYDWRRSNVDAAAQLKEYVRLVRLFHPEAEQVNIIAHSMGGLVARRFILDNPGVVNKLITLGTPWLGAPKAINALETGDFLDALQHVLVIKKSTLKTLAEFFPGPQELVPSPAYFNLAGFADAPFEDRAGDLPNSPPGTGNGPLSFPQFKQVMDDVYHTNPLVSPAAVSQNFHEYSVPGAGKQDDWSTDNTGVEYFHIIGVQSDADTIGKISSRLLLIPADDDPANLFEIKREFTVDYTQGDGTVPVLSSLRVSGTQNLNAPGAHVYRIFSPGPEGDKLTDHNGMLANPKLQDLVKRILDGDIPPADPLPGAATNITHIVRFVNAEGNAIVASRQSDPGLSSAPFAIGDVLFGLGGKLLSSHEEDIPGLEIEEPATNIVNAVLNGAFNVSAEYNGEPINVRIDQLVNGVIQQSFIWEGVNSNNFRLPPPPLPLRKKASIHGESVPLPVEFAINAKIPADSSAPALTLASGATQITRAPDAVLSGEAARDNIAPVLSFHLTNSCTAAGFTMSDNVTHTVSEVFVGDGPFDPDRKAKLRVFKTNIVNIADLRSIAAKNIIHVTARDANGNVAPPIVIDLSEFVQVNVFLDLADKIPLEDWPEVEHVSLRSPKRYIRLTDELHVKVTAPPNRPPGTYRVELRTEGAPASFIADLSESPAGSGIYRNSDVIDLAEEPASPLNQVDEGVITFNILNAKGEIVGCLDRMVDRAEFASGGIGTFYAAVDRTPVRDGALGVNGFFDAGDGQFSDDIGSFPNNTMAEFIREAGDQLPGSGQADVLHISSHGSTSGKLFDDSKIQAEGKITIVNGAITSAVVTTTGKGYTSVPTVSVIDTNTASTGSGAVITAVISGDGVAAFTIVNAGIGYTSTAEIEVSSPGPSNVIFDPAGPDGFGNNEGLWNKDVEWVILAACNTLNDDKNPSGLLAWKAALDGSPRPAHGILGANMPIQRRLQSYYALFWARLNAGDTFINAYIAGMENNGSVAQPWAYICYENYLQDSITNLAPDLATSGTFAFDSLVTSVECERCGTDRGADTQGNSSHHIEEAPPLVEGELPARIEVESAEPLANVDVSRGKRYNHGRAETVELTAPYQRNRVSHLSPDEARAFAQSFLSKHLPASISSRLLFESVSSRVSKNIPPTGPTVAWTNGFVVQFSLTSHGVPLWGDSIRVSIAGDEISSLTASASEITGEQDVSSTPVLKANEALSRALPTLKQSLALSESYGAEDGGIFYVSPEEWNSGDAASPKDEKVEYLLARRFLVQTQAAGPDETPRVTVWIDARTGALLGVSRR